MFCEHVLAESVPCKFFFLYWSYCDFDRILLVFLFGLQKRRNDRAPAVWIYFLSTKIGLSELKWAIVLLAYKTRAVCVDQRNKKCKKYCEKHSHRKRSTATYSIDPAHLNKPNRANRARYATASKKYRIHQLAIILSKYHHHQQTVWETHGQPEHTYYTNYTAQSDVIMDVRCVWLYGWARMYLKCLTLVRYM